MKAIILTFFLIPTLVFSQIGTTQDTINIVPHHIKYPDTHNDTIVVKGYIIGNPLDSSGTAIFLYDPEKGFWKIDSVLTGLID